MSKKRNNLLIAASGTGGHIFPALAVSKKVEKDWDIHWLGAVSYTHLTLPTTLPV